MCWYACQYSVDITPKMILDLFRAALTQIKVRRIVSDHVISYYTLNLSNKDFNISKQSSVYRQLRKPMNVNFAYMLLSTQDTCKVYLRQQPCHVVGSFRYHMWRPNVTPCRRFEKKCDHLNQCWLASRTPRLMLRLFLFTYPLPWASGLPVAIQCAWNLDPSVHWNATGEMPVCFQWSSSGFPVVFQCVPIIQINTGLPLGHHWVQASASVVPVASQCTCGSSGLPVCSNYAN